MPKEKLEHAKELTMVTEDETEYLKVELAKANIARIQDWEQNSGDQVPTTLSLKRTAGMNVHSESPLFVTPNKFFHSNPLQLKK